MGKAIGLEPIIQELGFLLGFLPNILLRKNMTKINRAIFPSMVTLGNLFCGFLAIAYIADNHLIAAAWLIFAGMIFDMLDGKVARLTKGSSDFGMQLDSLADMISFGVAPAFLAKVAILQEPAPCSARLVWVLCLSYVICAAVRLARFNVETDEDESSHQYFKGLATPAAAGVVASLVLSESLVSLFFPTLYYKIFLLMVVCILSILMVSEIRYVHFGVRMLKKRHLVLDLITLAALLILTIIKPQIFTLTLMLAFVLYSFVTPVWRLSCRIAATSKKEEIV